MPRFIDAGAPPPLPVLPCPDPLVDDDDDVTADDVDAAPPPLPAVDPPPLPLELDPEPLEEASWPQAVTSALMTTKVARRLHEDCSFMMDRSPEAAGVAQVFLTAAGG